MCNEIFFENMILQLQSEWDSYYIMNHLYITVASYSPLVKLLFDEIFGALVLFVPPAGEERTLAREN